MYLTNGLGFFRYGIVDQHFDNKSRLGRLVMTAYEKGDKSQFAYGVDENPAMIVNNVDKKIEILGKGSVTVIDLTKASKDKKSKATNMKNVIISLIDKGDSLNLATKEITINPSKELTTGNEYNSYVPTAVTGAFSSYGLWKELVSYDLVDNDKAKKVVSYCYDENGIGSQIIFRKTKDTLGYWAYKDGTMDDYSAVNISLDIKPITVKFVPRFAKK